MVMTRETSKGKTCKAHWYTYGLANTLSKQTATFHQWGNETPTLQVGFTKKVGKVEVPRWKDWKHHILSVSHSSEQIYQSMVMSMKFNTSTDSLNKITCTFLHSVSLIASSAQILKLG